MSLTPSTMLPLGTVAPDFTLFDTVSGQQKSLDDLKSDVATVIIFMCNHCPYVVHIEDKLLEVAHDYMNKGIAFTAISANDVTTHPADSPECMHVHAIAKDFPFPYLFDETQAVAKAYQAACTPDLYVFDKHMKCTYRGRFDDATPGNLKPVTGADLIQALDLMLAGKRVPEDAQYPSQGCNIKWKSS